MKAQPIWNGEMWIYRPSIKGVQKKYTSRIAGSKGATECRKKHSAAIERKSKVRLESAWTMYLEDVADRLGLDSESYRKSESIGKTHILPRLKLYRVSDITEQEWQECISKATPTRGGRSVLSKKTYKNIRAEIMAFCKYAKKADMVESIPMALYVPRTAPTIGKLILQPSALRTLLGDSSASEWYINAWKLMAATGLRPGEVYGLHREDVKHELITIRRSIRQDGKITSGKNDNALRVMAQTKISAKIIADQIAQLNSHNIGSAWLFSDEYGMPPNPVIVGHRWDKYRQGSGVTMYGLRHTFISMTKHDLPESMIKQLVGHSQSMDTYGVYGHEIDSDAKRAAKILDRSFSKIMKNVT